MFGTRTRTPARTQTSSPGRTGLTAQTDQSSLVRFVFPCTLQGHRFPRSLMRDDPTPPREAPCPSCRSVGRANEWGDRQDEPAGRSSRGGIQLSQLFGYPQRSRNGKDPFHAALQRPPVLAKRNVRRLLTLKSRCRPATDILPSLGTRDDARCSDPEHAGAQTSAPGRTSPTGQIDQFTVSWERGWQLLARSPSATSRGSVPEVLPPVPATR